MSTSLRRSAGSIATRKVIGWSLPSTLPTAANPSSVSARDTRSTAVVSMGSVSTRASGPNSRAIEAATLLGGAWTVFTSELVADAEAQHLVLARAGRVAEQLVVALERGVPRGLVREAEGGDAAGERRLLRDPGGDVGLRIVALVAHERLELLRRRGGEGGEHVIGRFHVAARDAAADRVTVGRVDRLGVAHGDVGDHPAEGERAYVIAGIGREQGDGSGEGAAAERRVLVRAAAVPERAAQLQPRPRPLEPSGERRVGEARLPALLAPGADSLGGGEPLRPEPVDEVQAVAQPRDRGYAPDRAHADLPPRGRDHVVVERRPVHSVEGGGLVRLVDDPHRRQHEPGAQREPVLEAVVQVHLLERHLAPRLAARELRVLDLELGAERQLVAERVGQVDDEALQVHGGWRVGARGVGVVDLPVAAHGGAFLGREHPRADGGGRQGKKKAPPEQCPHADSEGRQVGNGCQQRISELKIRNSSGQADYCCAMRFVLNALLMLAAGALGWGAIRLKRRLERSERDRQRAANELNRRLSELFSLQELSYILSGSLQLDHIVAQVVRYAMRFLDAQGALIALAAEGEGAGEGGAGGAGGAGAGGAGGATP